MRTAIAFLAIAALAACTQETTTTDAPDTTAEMEAPATTPTVVVITESDARTRAETAGYTNITGLTQNADGTWTATGTRDGQTTQLSIGEGGVTVVTTPAPTP
jgi:putative membrane protein